MPVTLIPYRAAVKQWSRDHNRAWYPWIVKSVWAPYAGVTSRLYCQVDEWPPYDLWSSRVSGVGIIHVRYLPGGQNGGASNAAESGISVKHDCKFCEHCFYGAKLNGCCRPTHPPGCYHEY